MIWGFGKVIKNLFVNGIVNEDILDCKIEGFEFWLIRLLVVGLVDKENLDSWCDEFLYL